MPEDQPAVNRTVEATVDAMSAVKWSMRVVRQARDRAEKRLEGFVRDLATTKRRMTEVVDREQTLRKLLDELRAENAQASSELAKVKREKGQMHLRMKDFSSKNETLITKLDKTRSNAEKERQALEDRMSQECQHLKSELSRATETIDDLSTQLAAGRGLHEDLQFNINTSRKTHAELKQMVSEMLESGQEIVSEIEGALIASPPTLTT